MSSKGIPTYGPDKTQENSNLNVLVYHPVVYRLLESVTSASSLGRTAVKLAIGPPLPRFAWRMEAHSVKAWCARRFLAEPARGAAVVAIASASIVAAV